MYIEYNDRSRLLFKHELELCQQMFCTKISCHDNISTGYAKVSLTLFVALESAFVTRANIIFPWDTWVVQSVEQLTLGFTSGSDLRVARL